jgi:hypothetical protein
VENVHFTSWAILVGQHLTLLEKNVKINRAADLNETHTIFLEYAEIYA